MWEAIILGTVQGIAEWLPVSSEGLIFIIKANFFAEGEGVGDIIKLALFLHLGTFLAALVYFRKEVWSLLRTAVFFKTSAKKDKQLLSFIFITTLISGLLGMIFIKGFEGVDTDVRKISRYINILVAGLLLITASLQIKINKNKDFGKTQEQLRKRDGVFVGIAQAFAAFPGLSRSGLTVAALLISEFKDNTALKLSFLLSLPIVLGGNIFLNMERLEFSSYNIIALLFSFGFGLLTIDLLLKVARRINFGYFVMVFALLMLIFGLV